MSPAKRAHAATIRRVEERQNEFREASMDRLRELQWFEALSGDAQGWVAEVVDAGLAQFLMWLNNPDQPMTQANTGLGSVPAAAAHAVTLEQTVELISTALAAVEPVAITIARKGDEEWLLQQIARYGREIAFAAALVYARVAEQRGAQTARQRSDMIDALVTGRSQAAIEGLASRLGFTTGTPVRAAACEPQTEPQLALAEIERTARRLDRSVLTALHEGLIVAIWTTRTREHPLTVARQLFGPHASAVVSGPADSIVQAGPAVRRAIDGLAARPARPHNREVLDVSDLLPERALIGEAAAQDELVERCYSRLLDSGTGLMETVDAMFDHHGVLEQAAKALPVHVNTLRYRLEKIAEVSGFDLRETRGAIAIFVGVSLGRMREATSTSPLEL